MIYKDLEQLIKKGRRLYKRRINDNEVARQSALAANFLRETCIFVNNGGSVSGAYGHVAETEGLVTVAFSNGYIYQKGARLSASKPSQSGILVACLGKWARPFLDPRFGAKNKEAARIAIIGTAAEALQSLDPGFLVSTETIEI